MDRVKEVKVKIPINYHIKLHSMKVLTGKAISDTVTEALEAYFGGMKTGPGEQELRAAAEAPVTQLGSLTSL
ncbi:MAG: hypothetical protein LC624_06755 [Halobacteriales archaeon]|nr:hypothetical protein [Halobacteriales archaeon]